jgi:hypothetical protein
LRFRVLPFFFRWLCVHVLQPTYQAAVGSKVKGRENVFRPNGTIVAVGVSA